VADNENYGDPAEANESILNCVKAGCGIPADHHEFDQMILPNINMAFGALFQIGVGDPDNPFVVTDDQQTWSEVTDQINMEMIKTFVTLKTRQIFDPPSGAAADALNKVLDEVTWRIRVAVEEDMRINNTDWEEA